jgi:transcriptional regulator with XRE-family HTH domain
VGPEAAGEAISEIEAGRRSVTGDELAELSRLFSVPVSDLLPSALAARAESPAGLRQTILRMGRVIVERFHPQMVILFEKSLKALLCFRRGDVPRIHDIEALLTRTGLWEQVELTVEESRLLTDYTTVTRDPSDYEPVSFEEAGHAVELAVRIRSVVRQAPGRCC